MLNKIFSLLSGLIFGIGLTISSMINPAKVIGFLDITGNWDPSLISVSYTHLTLPTNREV